MCGVYPDADVKEAGDEISSTYEGRHLTFLESELTHPSHTDGFVDKGDPVVVGSVIVGVAFLSAVAATDKIAIDTEGIWVQSVVAEDDDGNIAVTPGDELYINITTCIISKISNSVTNIPFGYALGVIGIGETATIAVKVHFDPALIGGILAKGLDHVQGTASDPIAWGVTGDHIKAMAFSVGILTDYINAQRIHMVTTDDITAGGVYNIYSRQDVKHDIQNMVGIHGLGYITPDTPVALTVNQVACISGQIYLNNPGFTTTLGDSLNAGLFTMDQSLTSAIVGTFPGVNGWMNGVFIYMNGIEHDNAGYTAGLHIHQGGGVTSFPDYGIFILQESENALAAMKIESKAIGMFGIEFESALGFGFTSMIRYSGGATVANCMYFLQFDQAAGAEGGGMVLEDNTDNTANSDYQINVRLAGDTVDRKIRLYE